MNAQAIVTLALGDYAGMWRRFCEPNWKQYAEKHGFDLICLEQPLDASIRAQNRSPSWQKCLVASLEVAQRYERIVWLDADIVINNGAAPNITDDVPLAKVGAVPELRYTHTAPELARELRERMREFWPHARHMIPDTAAEYYQSWGLPGACDRVMNAGVMVLSPRHHRAALEHVYYTYQDRPGPGWHMEMRPLSYELNRAGLVHWLDRRFNLFWLEQQFLHYSFLFQAAMKRNAERAIGRLIGYDPLRLCINVAFRRSYFFHIGGAQLNDIRHVDLS